MPTQQGDVIEASARMEFNGAEDVVNVFQYQLDSAPPVTEADTATDIINILEALYGLIVPIQTLLLTYRDIRLRNVTQGIVLGTFPWASLVSGAHPGDPVPPGVAALVNFSTSIARVSPRKYFGILTEASVDSDATWDIPTLVLLLGVGASLSLPAVGAFGTWSYGYLSPKSEAFETPVASTIPAFPAYQRRRKQGRGS